jgi:hypothetical protein
MHNGQRKLHTLVGSMVKMAGLPQSKVLPVSAERKNELPVNNKFFTLRAVRLLISLETINSLEIICMYEHPFSFWKAKVTLKPLILQNPFKHH